MEMEVADPSNVEEGGSGSRWGKKMAKRKTAARESNGSGSNWGKKTAKRKTAALLKRVCDMEKQSHRRNSIKLSDARTPRNQRDISSEEKTCSLLWRKTTNTVLPQHAPISKYCHEHALQFLLLFLDIEE